MLAIHPQYITDNTGKKISAVLPMKEFKALLKELEELKGLSYIKEKTISNEKALLREEIKEAVKNLALVRKGKLKARPAKDLLNEL